MSPLRTAAPALGVQAQTDSTQVFERAAEVFALLGSPLRLRILSLLCQCELHVGELRAALGSADPSVSQNLSTLYRCGVLTRQRRGAHVFYGIHPSHDFLVCDAVRRMVGAADGS